MQRIEDLSTVALDDIITHGTDISHRYLRNDNKQYKVFRYQQNVYVVRYNKDTSKPDNYVHMWRSNKDESVVKVEKRKKDQELLGSGVDGAVTARSNDKAVKNVNYIEINRAIKSNLLILDQLFILKENNIANSFVLGLWRMLDTQGIEGNQSHAVEFYMPKVDRAEQRLTPEKKEELSDQFIMALKKMNELGYFHPDLANNVCHVSPQNLITTKNAIKALDLDSGFAQLKDYGSDKKTRLACRDQWLYVYNNIFQIRMTRNHATAVIVKWYESNPGKTLSDNPHALLELYNKGDLTLPTVLVKDMTNNARNAAYANIQHYLDSRNSESKGIIEMKKILQQNIPVDQQLDAMKKIAVKRLNKLHMSSGRSLSLFAKKRNPENQKLYELLRDLDINNPDFEKLKSLNNADVKILNKK